MNKKFITLCVSALLAGGMVTPAFASVYNGATSVTSNISNFDEDTYYLLKYNNSGTAGYNNNALKVTKNTVTHDASEVSEYTLWKLIPLTVNDGPDLENSFELVNMAGIKLGVDDNGNLVPNGKYTAFNFFTNTLGVTNRNLMLAQGANQELVTTAPGSGTLNISFYTPAVNPMGVTALNNMFLNGFTLGVGYYDANDNNEFKDYTTEHALKGNPFQGQLTATTTIGTVSGSAGVVFDTPNTTNNEVYLKNGEEVVVLLNTKWSGLNNSLNATGYKFTTMTPVELANQLAADAAAVAAGGSAVVRSYIFKVTAPDVVSDRPLEVAVRIDGTTTTWEELYVSEVDNNYYLTTAEADNNVTTPLADVRSLQLADYANSTNRVYAYFATNNFVNPEKFFSYAWNIERLGDSKTLNPIATEWVDKETIGFTVPEGQWILAENDIKDGYEWTNRETTITANGDNRTLNFAFSQLRETNENDEYYGADIYRVGSTPTAQYYRITKAKNAEGVEINLDAWDEFDYFGADVKSNSAGVDNTYKIQFTSDLTGEPVYVGMNGVGELLLTNDATAAINFEADTVKTTDKTVIVNPEDENAYNDVFRILNTYIGRDDKNENWIDKTDTVSFYRYNFMHDGKYLHFNTTDNKFELVAPEYDNNGDIDNAELFDAFVIKEKGDDFVNILNVDNNDFDTYLTNDRNRYDAYVVKDDNGNVVRVAGEKVLAQERTNNYYTATQMMYFDFNFAEARQQVNIYDWNANAQLKLDYQNYDIYRNVAPTAPDTMAIYRTEFDDEFMYERGEFLGVTYDRNGYNAALFIDTAYVRNNTEKPLFMIGVRPEITPARTFCPQHGFDTDCPPQHLDTIPGYVDADYLTVLADSAAYHAAELQNPFLDDNQFTKLAFVAARHNVDTITVADGGAKATIVEGMQHPMVFAFRYVDHETGDFIIEGVNLKDNKKEFDAKENPYVTSYIRWNNGVPVMTTDITNAEVFNIMNLDETADPTANETIAAEGAVSVVATEGGVIVKGSDGKNVVVATILGKVVANETVNSDNETINTPAGIVVVSVDGESFKVVVK